MPFLHNDIATKQRLRDALNEEGSMGFEHNDIVTVDVMNAAIAAGGGGGGDFSTATVTVATNRVGLDSGYIEFVGIEGGDLTDIYNPSVGENTIVLYQGVGYAYRTDDDIEYGAYILDGNVTVDLEIPAFVITGDCSITTPAV